MCKSLLLSTFVTYIHWLTPQPLNNNTLRWEPDITIYYPATAKVMMRLDAGRRGNEVPVAADV